MDRIVTLAGKLYRVRTREDGTVGITTSWEVPSIADRWSVCPTMIVKFASVNPQGRLGRKVLRSFSAPPLRESLCFPVAVETAAEMLSGSWEPRSSLPTVYSTR